MKEIKNKHTTGPWRVDGFAIVAGSERLATICGDASKENAANAYLMAAAPDLLAAWEDMLLSARGIFGDDINRYPAQWREQVRAGIAAIAKARGAT